MKSSTSGASADSAPESALHAGRDSAHDSNRWLLRHAANRFSQCGEDGILGKVLEVIGERNAWCVEFGAWDGAHLSNTWNLIEAGGYSAVLIEGSDERYRDLLRRIEGNPRIHPINAFVGFTAADGLDTLLATTPIPEDFDVLSIDIDGNDYHVWKAVSRYRPKVVVVEYNPTIPTAVDFVQPADMAINQGASLTALFRLGRQKGYEPVSVTDRNAIFVRAEDFGKFDIRDNSAEALRPNEDLVTWIFCGYDGTVLLHGNRSLPWHGIPYNDRRMQQLPKVFRRFDPGGPISRFAIRQYRSLKKRGLL